MMALFITTLTQASTFLPLALALYVGFGILRVIDMTLDGSFVLGAAIFARLIELNVSPMLAAMSAAGGGAIVGMGVATMQRGQKIDSLLAGVLATFILLSGNLVIMNRPNISLLSHATLVSSAFAQSQLSGWMLVIAISGSFCIVTGIILLTRFGLILRAFGDNSGLLQRLGRPVEAYRVVGFALTNGLAAVSGCLTSQTVGYADISMGYGMTLTALGTVVVGRHLVNLLVTRGRFSAVIGISACLLGVLVYFFAINLLLSFEVNPVYLKMLLGLALILFLRLAGVVRATGVI